MLTLYDQYAIAEHYLCALINGDDSGMEPTDIDELNAFERKLPAGYTLDVADDEAEFSRCEVSGYMANCVSVSVYYNTL